MKKTSSAIIKLVLATNKHYASGLYPIILRVQFNGRKDKATGYTIPEIAWDAKKEQVKKNYPNSAQINKAITDFKNLIIERKLQFEINNEPYTAAMLFEEQDRDFRGHNKIFKDIMNDLIVKRELKRNTQHTYKVMFTNLSEFMGCDDFIITSIDDSTMMRFGKWMEKKSMEQGSIRTIFSKVAAIYNFAIDNNLADANKYPFKRFKYNDVYAKSNKKQALTREQIQAIENYFVTNHLIVNQATGEIYYEQGVYAKMLCRWTQEFTIAAMLFSFYAQGLAYCDIAALKLEDVKTEVKKINGEKIKYYIIDTVRMKTKRSVPIVIEATETFEMLFKPFVETATQRENYLFPILQSNDGRYNYKTDKDIAIGLMAAEKQVNDNMRKIIVKINEEIKKHSKKMKKDVDALLPTDVSFYAMRHSFATAYMQQSTANPVHLATMMGRSVNGIFGYVKELSKIDDIIAERNKIFNK